MTLDAKVDTEIIVFASGKGGTGKTSLIAALSFALTYSGHKVLLIDADRATDGLSLFILGPEGTKQLDQFLPSNTFAGILEEYESSKRIVFQARLVHRSGSRDHNLSYNALISGKGLYGDAYLGADEAPIEPWNRQFQRAVFQAAVQALFAELRERNEFDYILVDTRGGFSFESTDVAAAADSFIMVTEATTTNFYQDRNLVDRINAAAAQLHTKSLLRGIIINKATDSPELSYRQELVKEFGVRLEDTFSVALDPQAAAVYKTQRAIYRVAPDSFFAFDSLQAFQQILKVVTGQWPEERARRWNELIAHVDNAIERHNTKVEEVREQERRNNEKSAALRDANKKLITEMAILRKSHEQESRRQDILLEELRNQARKRDEFLQQERSREYEGLSNETARLLAQLSERESELKAAQVEARSRSRSYTIVIAIVTALTSLFVAYVLYTRGLIPLAAISAETSLISSLQSPNSSSAHPACCEGGSAPSI